MGGEGEGFAARWSKRKGAAREEDQTATEQPLQDASYSEEQETSSKSEELSEADFDDVDFDALDRSSDYTRFIQANVPAAIQRKALRKLWASDSVFEVLDGMNDYDEDFTGNGLGGKILKTAYKVGKGFIEETDGDGDNDPSENRDVPVETAEILPGETEEASSPVEEEEQKLS